MDNRRLYINKLFCNRYFFLTLELIVLQYIMLYCIHVCINKLSVLFYEPFENFCSPRKRWRLTNVTIEQCFFKACHTYFDTNFRLYGHLRGPVTFTPTAEGLAVELPLPVLTTWACSDRNFKILFRMQGKRSY